MLAPLIALVAVCSTPLGAQLAPPSTGGVVAVRQELRMLRAGTRVLMIGAHPDDEDTELLTLLIRGRGVEAAYLSLNRGEGGQNLIGPELGEPLGLLRTEELLAARQLDGAQQFFTRAYDFGFSKTLSDTWAHWPQDTVLKDVVRIIRRFRPQVIVSIFSGTPADGHGQHQAAGWAARQAFRAAGDSTRFPELKREEGLAPWSPTTLFRSTRFDTTATTLILDGGAVDADLGRSFHQIAMESRSRHRSQDMGRLQEIGPSPVRLMRWDSRVAGGTGLFDGIDTAAGPGDYVALVDSARALAERGADGRAAALLAAAEALLPGSGQRVADETAPDDRRRHLHRARAALLGVLVDAVADAAALVPGATVHVSVLASGPVTALSLRAPDGWTVTREAPGVGTTGDATARFAVRVPDAANAGDVYWPPLASGAALYDWSTAPPPVRGLPFGPAALTVTASDASGTLVEREVTYRFNDPARGEQRLPLDVVPRLGIAVSPAVQLWRTGHDTARTVTVTVTHEGADTTRGTVGLRLPSGWAPVPAQPFTLAGAGQQQRFAFRLRIPAVVTPGRYRVGAYAAERGGVTDTLDLVRVGYEHVRPRVRPRAAVLVIDVAPLLLPVLRRVGYLRGAADGVADALASVGVPLEPLDGAALARADLSRYDAIVIGPRAYETDTALPAANARLIAYARAGGLVIVQYQQYGFVRGGFAPYPLALASPHDRVTDETAPVSVIDPAARLLHVPNRLGPDDWAGWVQERALYVPHSWDARYRPVFSMHDPDAPPLDGSVLVAPVGRGTYVYTGLSFFRQLPAGVPGAFRLFANLLGLARARR